MAHAITEDSIFVCLHCQGRLNLKGKQQSNCKKNGIVTIDKLVGAVVEGSVPPPGTPPCAQVTAAIETMNTKAKIKNQIIATNSVMLITNSGFPMQIETPGTGQNTFNFSPLTRQSEQLITFKSTFLNATPSGDILHAHWCKAMLHENETVSLIAYFNENVTIGDSVTFNIYRYELKGKHVVINSLNSTIQKEDKASVARVDWAFDLPELNNYRSKRSDQQPYEPLYYFFDVEYISSKARSMPLEIRDTIECKIDLDNSIDIDDLSYSLHLTDKSIITDFIPESGIIKHKNLPIGDCFITIKDKNNEGLEFDLV